jgi:hypothetical protein
MTTPTTPQRALARPRRGVTGLRGLVAALFVVGAGVLVAGVLVEHATVQESAPASAAAPSSVATVPPSGHSDADGGVEAAPVGGAATSPAGGGDPAHPEARPAGSAGTREAPTAESVLGIHTESPPLVVLAVAVSLGAGLIVLRSRGRSALTVVAGLAVGFVVFDGAELAHQAAESRASLVALAALTAAIHGLAALGIIAVIVRSEDRRTPERT